MLDLQAYNTALLGVWLIVATLVAQMIVAAMSKATQPGAVPGKMSADLSHDSFVFRSNRTFVNSVENAPAALGAAFLAILAGCDPFWTAIWVWVYALARLLHMALYYAIATEKNPSPRSHFFLLGVVATIALIVQAALALL